MCLLDAYICIQNTHIYGCFVRIYMRVLHAYTRVKRHLYAFKVFGEKYTLD